jgi:cysteine desulfurase
MDEYASDMRLHRDRVIEATLDSIEGSGLNGHPVRRLCNNVNLSFEGISGLELVMLLSDEGIATSTASACSAGSVEPSHVLTAMGRSPEEALSSLRLGLSRFVTGEEVAIFLELLPSLVARLRR